MQRGFFIAGVATAAAERKMSSLNHNLANINTVGYRADRTSFSTYLAQQTAGNSQKDLPAAFVQQGDQFIDIHAGNYIRSNNPLDMAIYGDGVFHVRLPDGSDAYTKAGNFQLDSDGQLVTASGYLVLGESGTPISIPAGVVTVSDEGGIFVDGNQVGKLALKKILDPQALEKGAGSILLTNASNTAGVDAGVRVSQGELEGSNVDPILSMAEVIDTMRSYQIMMKVVAQYRNVEQQLSEKVGTIRG
ncbi:MAG: flagellar hook basal-body protein [Mariprofundaceae bacterium]